MKEGMLEKNWHEELFVFTIGKLKKIISDNFGIEEKKIKLEDKLKKYPKVEDFDFVFLISRIESYFGIDASNIEKQVKEMTFNDLLTYVAGQVLKNP